MYAGRITSEEKSTVSSYVGIAVAVLLTSGAIYFLVLSQKEQRQTRGFDPNRPLPTDTVLQKRLKPVEYFVVRQNGSQTPFQNEYWNNERAGIYVDVIDGRPLFSSLDKYDSGLGIPAFSKPITNDLLVEKPDNSQDMKRVEVRAKRSDAHLGHVFADPKSSTGRRYSIQSAALRFIPKDDMEAKGYKDWLSLFEKK